MRDKDRVKKLEAERDQLRECCRTWDEVYTSLFAGMNALGQKKMVPSADRMPPPMQMCIWFGWKGETKTWRLGALSRLQVEEEGLTHWMPLPDPPPSAGNVATPETTPREAIGKAMNRHSTPAGENMKKRKTRFRKAVNKTGEKNAELFRLLSKGFTDDLSRAVKQADSLSPGRKMSVPEAIDHANEKFGPALKRLADD